MRPRRELVNVTILPATDEERRLWIVAAKWSDDLDYPVHAYVEGQVYAWRFLTWTDENGRTWTQRTPLGGDEGSLTSTDDDRVTYASLTVAESRVREWDAERKAARALVDAEVTS